MEEMNLYNSRIRERLTSVPGEIWNSYNVKVGNSVSGVRKFHIQKEVNYIIDTNIFIIGYKTKEDIEITFEVTYFDGSDKRIITTSATSGVYALGGMPMFKGNSLELTKGNEIELYCVLEFNCNDCGIVICES